MIKQFFKKVLISYLIIICCIFTPTYRAYAASPAGWAFNSFNVATSVVTALKGGYSASVAVAKSPIVSKIGKGVVGGVIAGAAIPLAISQISGLALDVVDWVLDPANNAVKYKAKTPQNQYCGLFGNPQTQQCFSTGQAVCDAYSAFLKAQYNSVVVATYSASINGCVNASGGKLLSVSSSVATNDWKTISIPSLADKIYDNAKTDTASASVVNDAVKEYVNEGSADVALDTAKADADASHACGTGTSWNGSACVADTPTTPTTPTTDTPFDPTDIIDAIGKVFDAVMSLPDVINNALDGLLVDIKDFFQPVIDLVTDFFDWFKDKFTALYDAITDFFDWVKTEPTPLQAEPVDIQTPELPQMESTDLNFGGQCPQNFDIDIDLFGKPVNFTLFDSSVFCQFLSDWIRIPVIFSASLVAVYILGGRRID